MKLSCNNGLWRVWRLKPRIMVVIAPLPTSALFAACIIVWEALPCGGKHFEVSLHHTEVIACSPTLAARTLVNEEAVTITVVAAIAQQREPRG